MSQVSNFLNKYKKFLIIYLLFVSPSLFAAPADASSWSIPDLSTMIKNLSETMPALMQFVTALSYVMGIIFILTGIFQMKKFGEGRTMMSTEVSIKGPLIFLFVGGAMIFLPSSVQVGLGTFWETPTPYAYESELQDPWAELIKSIFIILQFIGTIAFIRGLILLTHLGGHGGAQHGTFGRAMAHIIGGVFLINIYQFIQTIANTFGIGSS